ncbi:hypothetical protein JCM8547_004311 [Rhodosporidiobolus lusitaniae]
MASYGEQAQAAYDEDPYGYGLQGPSLALNATFIALFAISLIAHIAQLSISRRFWWMSVMIVGGVLEVMGWSARVYSHFHLASDGYIAQICVLVIAPTFYSAALYWAGGLIIGLVAPQKSSRFLSPKWFKITFITADVVALVIQGIGGGMAGSAEGPGTQLDNGTHIMLAGIIVQLVVMIFFSFYMLGWSWLSRDEIRKSGTRMQLMLVAIAVASAAIIVRGGFRTAELNEGFRGPLAEDENMIILDAAPVLVCTFVLNLLHPHWFLRLSPSSPAFNLSRESHDSQVTMAVRPTEKGQAKEAV